MKTNKQTAVPDCLKLIAYNRAATEGTGLEGAVKLIEGATGVRLNIHTITESVARMRKKGRTVLRMKNSNPLVLQVPHVVKVKAYNQAGGNLANASSIIEKETGKKVAPKTIADRVYETRQLLAQYGLEDLIENRK